MKKLIFFLFLQMFLISVSGQTYFCDGPIQYMITSDSTVELTAGGATGGDVKIPSIVEFSDKRYLVTSIRQGIILPKNQTTGQT